METLTLPNMGDDWINGCTGQYIILSLKHSTPEFTMFWLPGDLGYTPHLVNAGRYSMERVLSMPGYYNDGINAIAVPLTQTALTILGLHTVLADYTMVESFYNRKVASTRG